MIAVLMVGGFFRSLQFTAVNALAYAEVPAARMSRATALAAVGQQVSLATGVAVGALTVEMAVRFNGQAADHGLRFPAGLHPGRADRRQLGADFRAACRRMPAPKWPTGCRPPTAPPTRAAADVSGIGATALRHRARSRWLANGLLSASHRILRQSAVRRGSIPMAHASRPAMPFLH